MVGRRLNSKSHLVAVHLVFEVKLLLLLELVLVLIITEVQVVATEAKVSRS
jgi:hypothetical protein